MDTNSFPTPFIVTVFEGATAFKQVLCSPSWQKSKGLFTHSNSPHARVLCCNAGSKSLKNTAELLEKGSGHSLQFSPKWTVTDDNACAPCPAGEYTTKLNLNTQCTPAQRDYFVPAAGLPSETKCSKLLNNSFTNPPNSTLCEICPAGTKMIRGAHLTTCEDCVAGKFQELSKQEECNNCPRGWYQSQQAKPFCLPCIPVRDFFLLGIFFREQLTKFRFSFMF